MTTTLSASTLHLLPVPECCHGYAEPQLRRMLRTEQRFDDFMEFIAGRVCLDCDGSGMCDGVAHHGVFHASDVREYLARQEFWFL